MLGLFNRGLVVSTSDLEFSLYIYISKMFLSTKKRATHFIGLCIKGYEIGGINYIK